MVSRKLRRLKAFIGKKPLGTCEELRKWKKIPAEQATDSELRRVKSESAAHEKDAVPWGFGTIVAVDANAEIKSENAAQAHEKDAVPWRFGTIVAVDANAENDKGEWSRKALKKRESSVYGSPITVSVHTFDSTSDPISKEDMSEKKDDSTECREAAGELSQKIVSEITYCSTSTSSTDYQNPEEEDDSYMTFLLPRQKTRSLFQTFLFRSRKQ